MNDIVFFDGPERDFLLPLTYLRPVCHCMVGIKTIEQKWTDALNRLHSYLVPPYLQKEFPYVAKGQNQLYINGAFLPNEDLLAAIKDLTDKEAFFCEGQLIAFIAPDDTILSVTDVREYSLRLNMIEVSANRIHYPEDILAFSKKEIITDYNSLVDKNASQGIDSFSLNDSVKVRGSDLFVGSNVQVNDAILNSTSGPIYIDDGVEIMENAVIKGPVYIGPNSKIHVGAKVYGDTILGPVCKVGGEIKRTVMFGYSNKAHDGFLGDSVFGKWCNLGADTNNSNMKNTYGHVSLYDIKTNSYRTTNHQFLGMILGDHTMSAINSSFNTGSVTGIFSNILDRAPDRFTPSFSWGKDQKYKVEKAIDVAKTVMARRKLTMSEGYEAAIRYLDANI